jgi:simple sugar transport system substrate-binding protein
MLQEALKSLPGVKAVEEENVPETDACAKSMESMVNLDSANIRSPAQRTVREHEQ